MKTDKFVVTGGTGFVGHNLIKSLRAHGKVLSLERKAAEKTEKKVGTLQVDIRKQLPDIPDYNQSIVIHTAALMKATDLNEFWDVNVEGTKNVLEWAAKKQATHFIYISSGGVYGYHKNRHMKEGDLVDPIGFYGYTKWMGEKVSLMYSKLYHMPVTVLRIYFPYGPNQKSGIFSRIYHFVLTGKQLTIKKGGSPLITPVHVDDLISAIKKVVETKNDFQIFNVCGDDSLSFLDIVRLYEKVCRCRAKLQHSDEDEGDLLGNNALIKKELGWKPRKRFSKEIKNIIGRADS